MEISLLGRWWLGGYLQWIWERPQALPESFIQLLLSLLSGSFCIYFFSAS